MSGIVIMASLPIEVSELIPMPCERAKARTTLDRAPLCRADVRRLERSEERIQRIETRARQTKSYSQ